MGESRGERVGFIHALATLPPYHQEVIVLREVDGLSYEEIAEAMDCPIGTVRSRIFRARDAIDQKLRPLLDTERASGLAPGEIIEGTD